MTRKKLLEKLRAYWDQHDSRVPSAEILYVRMLLGCTESEAINRIRAARKYEETSKQHRQQERH